MTTILNTVVFKKELTRQFTAIPIWWKMLKMVLSRQNHSYLYSMALSEKSLQFVVFLSAIYIQCPRCGISTFCRQYKPGETFVVTLGPFKGRWTGNEWYYLLSVSQGIWSECVRFALKYIWLRYAFHFIGGFIDAKYRFVLSWTFQNRWEGRVWS